MQLFRVMNAKGVGPYKGYMMHRVAIDAPIDSPWNDNWLRGIREEEVCAFCSLEDLCFYFCDEVLKALAEFGFLPWVCEAEKAAVRVGHGQCVVKHAALKPLYTI